MNKQNENMREKFKIASACARPVKCLTRMYLKMQYVGKRF